MSQRNAVLAQKSLWASVTSRFVVVRKSSWNSGRTQRSQKFVNTGRLPTNESPACPNMPATSAK